MDAMDQFGYPKIEPFDTGFMPVGYGHEIYYEQVGNRDGYPVVFLHGGPGSCCSEYHRRFFDPEKWRVILLDQRGCGKSRPLGSIIHNTTPNLVLDNIKLLNRLGVNEAVFFGGSWGSTLALATAVEFPERVSALIVRGIYLGNKHEMDFYYGDGERGIAVYHPEHWKRFIDFVPNEFRGDPLMYYYNQVRAGNKTAALELAGYNWGDGMSYLIPPNGGGINTSDEFATDANIFAEAMIIGHYFTQNCFLQDGALLRGVKKLDIPVSITQGRYDMVCQPKSAWLLHEALGGRSDLAFTMAGHASDDPETLRRLIGETNRIYDLMKNK